MVQHNEVHLQHPEYDISNADELDRELSVLAPGDATINVANVQYMDTTALRSLLRFGQNLSSKAGGAKVRLKNASPSMRRIFEVVGFAQMFDIE